MKAIVCLSKKTILILCVASITACNNSTESVRLPNDFNPEEIIAKQNKLSDILTKDMVAKVVNVPVEKIETHMENKLSKNGQYTLLFSWQTGGNKAVGEGVNIPEYHSVSIGFVSKMDKASFEKRYAGNVDLQRQIDEMTNQESFNKEIAISEAHYLSDYAQRRKLEKLQHVATAAYWEQPINALHVLADQASFTITANFGDNEALAKKLTIRLASEILNR